MSTICKSSVRPLGRKEKWDKRNYYLGNASLFKRLLTLILSCILTNFTYSLTFQENNIIQGKVTDDKGIPLEAVTITIKNTTLATATDSEGFFELRLPSAESVELRAQSLGFEDKVAKVSPGDTVTLVLVRDGAELDEVVVIGFGTVKKRDLTGSVTSIKAEDIIRSPAHNSMESIQGQVPGLDITRNSGSATSGVSMNIRGNRSLSGANSPLLIIDGMQGGSVSDIHPQDIESIDVLKDASSTAIYGSQGANGVIIVTTKRGRSGRPKVNYNGYVGANGWAQYPDLRTGDDYIRLRREAAKTAGQWEGPEDDQTLFTAGEWLALQNNQWVNWKDEVFHTGLVQNHQLSVNGGNENTTALLSGGYYRELGTFKNDQMDKYNLRLNIDQNVGDYVKLGTSSQITHYGGQNRAENVLWRAATNVPLGLPYDENGNVVLWPVGREGRVSPLADEATDYTARYQNTTTNIIANGFAEVKPLAGLSLRSNFGVNLAYDSNKSFEGANSINRAGEQPNSLASINNTDQRFLNWDNIVNYTFEIADHSFTATGLTSWTKSMSTSSYLEGMGQLIEEQLWHNLSANQRETFSIRSGYVQSQTFSYALRLNYSFLGKYLVTLSNRWDGASRLSPSNQWAAFPSVALGWRVSDEGWFNSDIFSDFKVRTSYGQTGNSGINEYGTQSYLTGHSNAAFQDRPFVYYVYNNMIGNENLGWERSASWNLGVDVSLFNGRVNLVADVYDTKTTDILLPRTLPTSMGSGNNTPFQIYQNIGSSSNRGVELVLNTKNISNEAFSWNSDFTFGANRERITNLVDGRDIIGATTRETESLLIGRPLQSFYTFQRLGIWQEYEAELAATYFRDEAKTQPFRPGDIKLADLNGDNVIDDVNDVTYIGSRVPRWTLGVNNTFTFKGFDLNVYAIARWGQMMEYDFTGAFNPHGRGNQVDYLNYWTPDNPTNDFPRPDMTDFYNYYGYQSYSFVDGSYIKLKTITLGYRLPQGLTKSSKVNGLRVFVSGNNIYSWAKSPFVQHYDAERGGSATSPLLRQFVLGINIDL